MATEHTSDWERVEFTLPNPRRRDRWEVRRCDQVIRAEPTITMRGQVRRGTIGSTPVIFVRVPQTPECAYSADEIHRVRFLAPGGTPEQRALVMHHYSHRSYLTSHDQWHAFADVIFDDAFWLDIAKLILRP